MTAKVTTLPEIEGVEQLNLLPPGYRAKTTDFYSDEADLLVKMARSFRSRYEVVIYPAQGWPKRIYKKRTIKTPSNEKAN